MTPGVVSLRCPACERPFLSLPQSAEKVVTCPHCSRKAVMAAFSPAGSGSFRPVQAVMPVQTPSDPLPQPGISPFQPLPGAFQGALPVWPKAPESPSVYSPPTGPVFPPAPAIPAPWELMGLVPERVTSEASPFAAAASPTETSRLQVQPLKPPSRLSEASRSGGPPATSGVDDEEDERDPVLGYCLLLVLLLGAWILWESQQPPAVTEYPLPTPPQSAVTVPAAAALEVPTAEPADEVTVPVSNEADSSLRRSVQE